MSQVQWLCKLPGDVAARNTIQSLQHYYEVKLLELLEYNTLVSLNSFFPYQNSYTSLESPGSVYCFKYNMYVGAEQSEWDMSCRLLFFAETAEEIPKNLCIKFVRKYEKEAHQQCIRRKFAPALYLKRFPEDGTWSSWRQLTFRRTVYYAT